jgi:pyrroline-5-carboxylate reductase
MNQPVLGFIGAGNMASAIIKGALNKNILDTDSICVYDVDNNKCKELKDSLGINIASSIESLCEDSGIIFLAIKPNVMASVLNEIVQFDLNEENKRDRPIVSIAAGWSSDKIKSITGAHKKVLRVMPNTPLLAGEGMSVFEVPSNFEEKDFQFIEHIFSSLGKVEKVPVKLMDAVTAVSGSGPAYVYMFIEALSDAGVLYGLPRDTAITLAAQTVLGAAKMVLDTGKHPGKLKDEVCSPGGTTIEAVKVLEQSAFRGSVISAVEQCAKKSKALSE